MAVSRGEGARAGKGAHRRDVGGRMTGRDFCTVNKQAHTSRDLREALCDVRLGSQEAKLELGSDQGR